MDNSTLTKEELQWIKKVQKLLDNCPSKRLGFYTTGDSTVPLFDVTKDHLINDIMDGTNTDFGPAVDACGAYFNEYLSFPNAVHSVAG